MHDADRTLGFHDDQLVSEALQLLNSLKITALIVVEAERPVGIVHFHDLLRAGVA